MASADAFEGKAVTWEQRIEGLDAKLSEHVILRTVALKFGVKPWVVTVGAAVWVLSFICWGFTGELIYTMAAYMYPAYASFKAIEDGSAPGIAHWLRFWLTYAVCSLLESLMYKMLVWFPFYHLLRIAFIVWLFLPRLDGAQTLYGWVVGPILRKYRPSLDASLGQLTSSFGSVAWQAERRCASRCAGELQKAATARLLQAADFVGTAATAKAPAGTPTSPGERPSPSRESFSSARARTASPAPVAAATAVAGQAGGDIKAD